MINQGFSKNSSSLRPSSGVVFQPDIEKTEKISGEPYKKKLREFQKAIVENLGNKKIEFVKSVKIEENKAKTTLENQSKWNHFI